MVWKILIDNNKTKNKKDVLLLNHLLSAISMLLELAFGLSTIENKLNSRTDISRPCSTSEQSLKIITILDLLFAALVTLYAKDLQTLQSQFSFRFWPHNKSLKTQVLIQYIVSMVYELVTRSLDQTFWALVFCCLIKKQETDLLPSIKIND